jgi:hypothetical protein
MGDTTPLVHEAFPDARIHYNRLITIERVRRDRYRRARSAMFPELATLEAEYAQAVATCDAIAADMSAQKARTKTRAVDAGLKAGLLEARAKRKEVLTRLRAVRDVADESAELKAAAAAIDTEAKDAVKALRPGTYWGTYLLVEGNAQRAKSDARGEPAYNEAPVHLCKSRIGVHFCGGIDVAGLASSTLMQIEPLARPSKPGHPIGEKRREQEKLLRFRIGTEERKPVWALFPLLMHRPLPADGRVKDAYITRRPHNVTMPWSYELCVVLESASFFPTPTKETRSASAAINFGWLAIDGGLRVATVNGDDGIREIRLPADILGRFAKAEELRGLCDDKFNTAKAALAAWLKVGECPDGFRAEFENVDKWRSPHRMMDLVWYWREHRFDGDTGIFATMDEWRERYRHLMKWAQDEQAYCQRFRDNFYQVEAKRLATENARVTIDTFKIADVAKRAAVEKEETGGQSARHNRVLASPADLRSKIIKACAKYGCEVVAATSVDGTKRCNHCGAKQEVQDVVHRCVSCGLTWDRDVNNTRNLLSASASGEVTPIVSAPKGAESLGQANTDPRSFRATRESLARMAK